ncbi:ABC transporter substrate-binding protein [Patescibacteria group bacterium]|nr:ABC transporter substrate-binding protein [Patescibacteria group bacterium]
MNLKSLRLSALILWQYLKRNKKLVLGILVLVILVVIFQLIFNIFHPKNVIKIGLVGTYQEHDLPSEVTKLISVPLVEASSDGRIKPLLVTGWDVNNDATKFQFKLKDNLKWADNSKVKASDLEFSIPNTSVSFPDDRTIEFSLKESYSPLPSVLMKPIFKKGTLLGLGTYKIATCRFLFFFSPHPCIDKSRIFIAKITLQPNDPKLPDISIRFYPSEKVAVTGFNLGEVQVLLGLNNIGPFSSVPLVGIKQKTDYSKIVTLLFQTQDFNLRNRSLRQALSFATPEIKDEESANNPYPPYLWAYNSDSKKYLANPKEAQAALERAKSQIPDDKLYSELILTAIPNLEEVGKAVVASWKQLGFDAKLRVESGIPQNFQALLITQSIPVDPDQYSLWHATQTKTNLTKYDSKRVDKDLEDGRKIITESERQAKYFDFQKTLLEDAPAIFLYFPKYNTVYLKKIEPLLEKISQLSN